MKKVEKLSLPDVAKIISVCSSNYRDKTLKKKFTDSKDAINDYSVQCVNFMKSGNCDRISPLLKGSKVSGEEMRALYTHKFSQAGQPGRSYYEKILHETSDDVCLYCGSGRAKTLDHYLAKTVYPYLAVSPENLIPACSDCNRVKGTLDCADQNVAVFHPYFDEKIQEEWLQTTIRIENNVPIAEYGITRISGWSEEDYRKACAHFESFALADLYREQAADEMPSIKSWINDFSVLYKLSEDDISQLLEKRYIKERQYDKSSWKTALYGAAYSSGCFINWLREEAADMKARERSG